MAEREQVSLKAQSFFNDLWTRGDPGSLKPQIGNTKGIRVYCRCSISPDTGVYSKSAAVQAHSRGVLPDWRIRCWLWTSRPRPSLGREAGAVGSQTG